jgi:putative heme-binding domain-containing protein
LEGLGLIRDEDVIWGMSDSRAEVREHAVRLAEPRLRDSRVLADRLSALATDPAIRVRFQVALAVGELASREGSASSSDRRVKPLARIIEKDVNDPWMQIAVLSSAAGVAGDLWFEMDGNFGREATEAKATFVERIASIVGSRRDDRETELFLGSFSQRQRPGDTWWQLAAIHGLASGLRPAGTNLPQVLARLPEELKPAAVRIDRLLADSSQIAVDAKRPVAERVAAARLLVNLPAAELTPIVEQLLDISQPQEVQVAAVAAMDSVSGDGVVPVLLDGWSSHSPPVRREVIDAIFRRRERVLQLLDAIEAGKLKVAELDLNRHQQLLNHAVPEIKQRSERLFAREGTPNRKEVIESYRTVLARPGDPANGREVFKKNCATCHQIQGEGHRVGPELTGLRTRNREALLMDILDPNRALEPNYANYLVATKDGRVLSGIIAGENATSITLRRAEGIEEVLLRQDLEQIRASGQSLMPDGLERNVTQAEMADLIEYLRTVP